jgi:hypothetical protein
MVGNLKDKILLFSYIDERRKKTVEHGVMIDSLLTSLVLWKWLIWFKNLM